MIKWYHCIKCNYYWQSNDSQYKCLQCGADAYVMLKMTLQHSRRLEKFFEIIEQDMQRSRQYDEIKQTVNNKQQSPSTIKRFTPYLSDNRSKVKNLYNNGNENIRHTIQKSIKNMKVNGNNGDLLKARISNDGIIEIINEKTSRIILWNYLTDSERWSFWQQFNSLMEKVKR